MSRDPDRLDGWKSVAGYLEVSINTARRYHELGMPVHRLGGRYFAIKSEIDEWRRAYDLSGVDGRASIGRRQSDRTCVESTKQSPSPAVGNTRRTILMASLSLAAIATAFGLMWKPDRKDVEDPARLRFVAVSPTKIRAVDDLTGDRVWEKEGLTPSLVAVIEDGRGGQRIAAALMPPPNDSSLDITQWISWLDPEDGSVVGRTSVRPRNLFGGYGYKETFAVRALHPVSLGIDGAQDLLVTFNHQPNWPAITMLLEHSGASRELYASAGHHDFRGLVDLDGDSQPEILFEGLSNQNSWFTSLAAARVFPRGGERTTQSAVAYSPDLVLGSDTWKGLVWYALLPPGGCDGVGGCVVVDSIQRTISVETGGRRYSIGFDGFPTDYAVSLDTERRLVVQEFWSYYRRGLDSLQVRDFEQAFDSAVRAEGVAQDLALPLLEVSARVLRARAEIRLGRAAEGFRTWEQASSEFPGLGGAAVKDVAVALHLSGELELAGEWFEAGLSGEGAIDSRGRPSFEYLRGLVGVRIELGQFELAALNIRKYSSTVGSLDWLDSLAEVLRWSEGKDALMDCSSVIAATPDLVRYWCLELGGEVDEPLVLVANAETELLRNSEASELVQVYLAWQLHRIGDSRALRVMEDARDGFRIEIGRSPMYRMHRPLVQRRCDSVLGADSCDLNPIFE